MRDVFAAIGIFFIIIWMAVLITNDDNKSDKEVAEKIAIIKAAENTGDDVVEAQAAIARAELKAIQAEKELEAQKEVEKAEAVAIHKKLAAEAAAKPPSKHVVVMEFILTKILPFIFMAGFIVLFIGYVMKMNKRSMQ